ncbi:MAG TPA: glycine cleavage T C-terminal barrel domain-containing protein, partial [Verrucomicrobiae bacterium]|nr:glycine cleavage T C-terminal barrel domain-containing protein [Verrucomicrobiae bacterium]
GHDMNDTITPLEAGIGWAVNLTKDFTGAGALKKQAQSGPQKKLIGFEMLERGIPREGYAIVRNGEAAGAVTSGTFAPTLKKNIGLGYVRTPEPAAGEELAVRIRDRDLKAIAVKLPFYKRTKS